MNLSDLELGDQDTKKKEYKWSKNEICFICQNPGKDHVSMDDNLSSNNAASDSEKLLRAKSDSDNIASLP